MWCWSDCEEILHVQGQRSPSKVVEWQNHIYNQTPYPPEMLRGLKHTLCTPGPRDPMTEPELCLGVSWGDTLCPKAKEKPQQDGRRGEFTFRIKPHTCQRLSESSNKPCAHQDPDIPQRLRQNCVWVSPVEVQVSNGLLQGWELWV